MVIAPACGGNISTVSPAPAAPVITTAHLEAQAGGQPAAGLWATSEMSRVTVSKAGPVTLTFTTSCTADGTYEMAWAVLSPPPDLDQRPIYLPGSWQPNLPTTSTKDLPAGEYQAGIMWMEHILPAACLLTLDITHY